MTASGEEPFRLPSSAEAALTFRDDLLVPSQLADFVLLHHVIRADRVDMLRLVRHDLPDICPCVPDEDVIAAWVIGKKGGDVVHRAAVGDVA